MVAILAKHCSVNVRLQAQLAAAMQAAADEQFVSVSDIARTAIAKDLRERGLFKPELAA